MGTDPQEKARIGKEALQRWIARRRLHLHPPGCVSTHFSSPCESYLPFTATIVPEHRFAFVYWALLAHERGLLPRKGEHNPPVLLTVDYHNDVGAPSEVKPEDLDALDLGDAMQLSLFAWLSLRSLNDGQILPALYLDLFTEAFVLLKDDCDQSVTCQQDSEGRDHAIRYFYEYGSLVDALTAAEPERVYIDIDLDYFALRARGGVSGGSGTRTAEDCSLAQVFSLEAPLMAAVYSRLVGMTIALEPSHSGGYVGAVHSLESLERLLFLGGLRGGTGEWRMTV